MVRPKNYLWKNVTLYGTSTEAEGRRELVQHGVLPSLAGPAGAICTVLTGLHRLPRCTKRLPWQRLLSC
jgi:hypothetical protein